MSMLKAKVAQALEKIGTTNGTAPKQSQDPMDKLAHEYNVASQMSSYAEKRKELAKDALVKALSPDEAQRLDKARAGVRKTEVGDTITVVHAANHTVSAQIKNGPTFLDTKALTVDLMKMLGSDEAEKLIDKHTKRRDPSVTWIIGELGDG